MSLLSWTRARRRSSRAALLLAVVVVGSAFVITTRESEARGVPGWLSRLMRAVSRRESVASLAPDTIVVFGPKVFSMGSATSATFVEKFILPAPVATLGSGYLLRATNGTGGAARVTSGVIVVNGAIVVGTTTLAGLASGASVTVPVELSTTDTLIAALRGPAGSAVSITVLAAPDPTFYVFGPKQYERATGKPVTVTEHFSLPPGAAPPSYLCFRNGDPDGTRRTSSAVVRLNGVDILHATSDDQNGQKGQAGQTGQHQGQHADDQEEHEVHSQTAAFRRRVTFLPANTLEIELRGAPGSRLTVCGLATDSLAPRLTITAPVPGFITRASTVDAVGSVIEQTAVKITVNGLLASLTPGTAGQTGFTVKVPLAAEGPNTLAFVAVDAAGNRTDSTRTVIRDTQPPVVTLTSLPDGATVRADSVLTVTGTITDLTRVTANINGQPLAIDSVSHAFSQRITLANGINFVTVTATDAAGNAASVVRQVTVDHTPPTITVQAPAAGLVTQAATVRVSGTVTDETKTTLTVNGAALVVAADGGFAGDIALVAGANTLSFVAVDAAGNRVQVDRKVVRDNDPPVVLVASPSDLVLVRTVTVTVRGTITDASAVTATLNGVPLTIAADRSFQSTIALSEGVNSITLVATDAAGNRTSVMRSVTLDTTAPVLTVSTPVDNATTSNSQTTVAGTATDQSALHVTVNSTAVTLSGGAFTTTAALVVGANTITVVATDSVGNAATVVRTVQRSQGGPALPPDPATVATPLSKSSVTPFGASIAFLYSGTNPVQRGVTAGAISAQSASVLRGIVTGTDGLPISGVLVSSLGHAGYGTTLTRQNGAYDFVANGGEPVTISLAKAGYATVQRTITPRWGGFASVDAVVMTALDSRVTQIDFTRDTIARGSVTRDASGPRQATMLFRAGTTAQLRLADGSTRAITTASVRATEFTVGPRGRSAMPGALPAASAYTYAVDLTVDEAIAANAQSVEFSQPVSFYVENFLRFPVGGTIPVGYYDRTRGVWVSSPSARVIRIIGLAPDSLALVAVDTTGVAASASRLSQFGIDDVERAKLARTYAVGQSLWRMPVTHFTPYDVNPSWEPPPLDPDPRRPAAAPDVMKPENDNKCNAAGSIIGCTDATLGETIGISGTPLQLTYQSQRVGNAPTDYTIAFSLPITARDSAVRRVDVEIEAGGQRFTRTYDYPTGVIRVVQPWDGRDVYGRSIYGPIAVNTNVRYTLHLDYLLTPENATIFGIACNAVTEFGRGTPHCLASDSTARQLANLDSNPRFWVTYNQAVTSTIGQPMLVGRFADVPQGLGGWRLSVHHAFDPINGVLSLGTGETRSARASNGMMLNRIVGDGLSRRGTPPVVNGIPAIRAALGALDGLAVAADGSMYIVDNSNAVVRKVLPNGIITTVAGNGSYSASGDGGPALQAGIDVFGIALGTEGDIYLADQSNHRIRRIDANGIITTAAGNGRCGSPLEGARADSTSICSPEFIKVGPDGGLYFTQQVGTESARVYRMGADNRIALIAGGAAQYCQYPRNTVGDPETYCGNGGPARDAGFDCVYDMAFGLDGTLYVTDCGSSAVRRIDPSGIVHHFAGNTQGTRNGDGGPALIAGFTSPGVLAMGPDGTLYVGDTFNSDVRAITPDGIITTVVGDFSCHVQRNQPRCAQRSADVPQSSPARSADYDWNAQLVVTPDNRLLIASVFSAVVLELKNPLKPVPSTNYIIPSSDLSELYVFDNEGKHLRTEDALSRAVRYSFRYGADGLLESITDAVGATTQVLRDGARALSAFVSPDGLRTTVTLDGNGYLRTVSGPEGQLTTLTIDAVGLLTQLTAPNGGVHTFTYANGHLVSDRNADQQTQTVSFTQARTSQETVITSPLGRTRRYQTAQLPNGDAVTVTINAAGLADSTVSQGTAQTRSTSADGTVTTTVQESVDTRFGGDAVQPVQVTVVQPSGLTSVLTSRRTVVVDSLDPLRVVSILDSSQANGLSSTSRYTTATRTVTSTSAAGRTMTSILDSLSRPIVLTPTGLATTRLSYDARDRLQQVVNAGRATTFSYDGLGHLTSIADPLGLTTRFTNDSMGRMLSQQDATGTIAMAYDTAGNLRSLTPAGGSAHRFTYTVGGLLTSYQAPAVPGVLSSTTTYRYDADQQLRALVRPDGDSVVFSYDAAARPTAIAHPDGSTTFAYGALTGALTSIGTRGGGTYALGYDGSLLQSAVLSGGPVLGTVGYTYDTFLRLSSLTVNGTAVSLAYDADGLLTSAGALALARSAQIGLPTSATVDATTTAYRYDSTGSLTGATTTANGSAVYDYTLTRDVLDRIARRVETVSGVTSDTRFAYDSSGRLSDVTRDGIAAAAYQYDANGNRLRRTSSAGIETGVVDAQDRLMSYGGTSYQYTDAGELRMAITGPDTTMYHYDALGALRWVTRPDGTRIDYVIDAFGRRIGKKVNGVLTQGFLYESDLRIAAVLTPSGAVLTRFVYGAQTNVPEYMIRGGTRYRFVTDHLGSVRLVVDATTGAVQQRVDYDESGRVLLNTNPGFQPFGYAGGLLDDVTGLVRFGARDYDARSGRFVQADPIGLAGGINRYRYAGGDPVNFADPSGLCPAGTHAASVAEGGKIVSAGEAMAAKLAYNKGAGGNSSPEGGSDCSGFVMLSQRQAGFGVPYTTSRDFGTSPNYEPVTGDAQRGDVMWQPGHVGMYTGHGYKKTKNPSGLQIGSPAGVREGPFGVLGWFPGGNELKYFRRCIPGAP